MIAVLDTNFLVKYFLASTDLGIKAKELNIHDGIIFATARIQKENFKEDIYVLTKDKEIANLSQNDVIINW